ncbi:MAG: hypothetical protein MJ016_07545 [Victivallaceae bacterium]|nr:hypothetical protein [Victivallaceae bacterium]
MKSDPLKKLHRLVGEAVVRYRMISPRDRVLVALSGGKDSAAMLESLVHLRDAAPIDFTLVGATFDPGYADFDVSAPVAFCRRFGIEHRVVSCDVDAIIREKKWQDAPCVLCSRLRRGHLYKLAKTLDCTALALGQHLDDAVVSFFMSVCRGQGISSMAPNVPPQSSAAVRVIRPLILAPEALIRQCAETLAVPEGGHCPYEEQLLSGDRKFFRDLVDRLDARIGGVRSNILRSFARIEPDHLVGGCVARSKKEPDDAV